MTYGDGIWLMGFVLLPNGERPIMVKDKHSTRDMDEMLTMKSVSR